MNKNRQEPITKVSARRRLVRGAFSAPVALSLYSGSALANMSQSCVAKDVNKMMAPATVAIVPSTDTWIRVRLYTMTKNNGKVMSWISGADLAALNSPSSYLLSTQWQLYSTNAGSPPFSVGQIIGFAPTARNWTFNSTANGAWVAVRVDAAGNITGVVGIGSTTNGYAVHHSCWTSFRKI